MKITFILPAIGKKKGQKYIKTWKNMEPLMIAVLKSLTPEDVETNFMDDRNEFINYEENTDLVVISVETYTAKRAYEIAKKFQKRGIKVLAGGYHPTVEPDECLEHFDSIILGNAESVWTKILNDLSKNKLEKRYYGVTTSFAMPDRSIYKDRKYSPLALIETGRGCNFGCDFCAIHSYYQKKYFRRPIEEIVQDIKNSGKKYVFFIDDNFVADHKHAIEICKAIEPLNIKWVTQGAITIAKNDELLYWMKKSGCKMILIGYESMNPNILKDMGKGWRSGVGEINELTEKIHSYGIGIYATFVFGYGNDTKETFDETVKFAKKHGFYFAAFNHLVPFPKTGIYRKLREEKRLLSEKWWLDENYPYGRISFLPSDQTPDELSKKCANARKSFFGWRSILKRGFMQLKRSHDLGMFAIFFAQNFNLKKEGYDVIIANDGERAVELAFSENPDLILLDLMLPKKDGMEVCREVRAKKNIPIIMLTAKNSEIDKVLGLEFGADDYVTKPFSTRELMARVKVNLRRVSKQQEDVEEEKTSELAIKDIVIYPDAYVIKKNGKEIDLTRREFDLFYYLAQHPGQVLTRENLLQTVWGYDYFGDVRTVDVTVRRLREKVETDSSQPEYIMTRRGVGYFIGEE